MSYCTLPKKQIFNKINPTYTCEETLRPVISFSLIHFLKLVQEHLDCLNKTDIELICSCVNPYEFIHNKVIGSKFSVSKINADAPDFYALMEIINSFNIFESFLGKDIRSMHCSDNNSAVIDCLNIFRENNNDFNYSYKMDPFHYKKNDEIDGMLFDFLYFDSDSDIINKDEPQKYTTWLINVFCHVLTYQQIEGVVIIKVQNIYEKPVLDIIYLLTGLYEKVYIIKPNASNILKNERFIVCKNFLSGSLKTFENTNIFNILTEAIKSYHRGVYVSSITGNNLPYYFLNKIEESNVIIGQQQLEHYDIVINTLKNKNRFDKIETLKKNNIQKCIQWCEKNKIPYNKFVEKLNIFLPISHSTEIKDDSDNGESR